MSATLAEKSGEIAGPTLGPSAVEDWGIAFLSWKASSPSSKSSLSSRPESDIKAWGSKKSSSCQDFSLWSLLMDLVPGSGSRVETKCSTRTRVSESMFSGPCSLHCLEQELLWPMLSLSLRYALGQPGWFFVFS